MILSLLLFLLPLLFFCLKHFLYGVSKLPPGPNVWQVFRTLSQFRDKPHVAFHNLAKIHGPLMSLRLGGQILVVASSSATAKEILKTHDRILSGRYLPSAFYKVPGARESSLTMSRECNDTWKFLRGISHQRIFSSRAVDSKGEIRKEKVADMMEFLLGKVGEVVKLDDIVSVTVLNVVTSVIASRNLLNVRGDHEKSGDQETVKGLVNEIVETAAAPGLADLFPILKRVDFWSKGYGVSMHQKIMRLWGDIIKDRKWRHGTCRNGTISARDFSDVLLENGFPDHQISIILTELLIAGTDSTVITIVWLIVELLRNQEILCKAREEIAQAVEENGTFNESLLSRCAYFRACIKETLRLHIPGPFLVPHRATETCKVDKYVIPRDSTVLVNAWAVQLDPDNWTDATRFKPDRFVGSKIDFVGPRFEFIPFSAGRRMCPGYHMGFRNVQLVVASLIHNFDWSVPDGGDARNLDTADKFGTTLKREKPLLLIPRFRWKIVV